MLAPETIEDTLSAAGVAAGTLTAAQKAVLDDEGFLVLPGILDEARLAQLRRAFDGAERQASSNGKGTQHVRLAPEQENHRTWLGLAIHPLVLAVAWHVLARRFRLADLHGRSPLPGFGQQGLHADWLARGPQDPYAVVTSIWMLDDFTVENGSTRIVPRTHRAARSIPKPLAQPLAHHPDERVITGRAGSVLIFNGHLWHSGTQNRSREPRRAAQMIMLASEHRHVFQELQSSWATTVRDPLVKFLLEDG